MPTRWNGFIKYQMIKINTKHKALVLFSGGLDSMLAAKLLLDQGIEVTAICFISSFFNAVNAQKAAAILNIVLKTVDIGKAELELVKNPPNGYGKHLNPCIDCHAMMVKKAAEIARQEGFNIIASGEVLGQRPFSQTRSALKRVEKIAGAEILRPLSAKALMETDYEVKGLVKRELLLNIKGRSRARQLQLAKKYKFEHFASPAGGCLLTDGPFSQRLSQMLEYWPECGLNDVELLKNGRVYWLKQSGERHVLMIVGRDREENQKLHELKISGDILIELDKIMGPSTLIRSKHSKINIPENREPVAIPEKINLSGLNIFGEKADDEIINLGCILTGYYATKARGKSVKFKIVV